MMQIDETYCENLTEEKIDRILAELAWGGREPHKAKEVL